MGDEWGMDGKREDEDWLRILIISSVVSRLISLSFQTDLINLHHSGEIVREDGGGRGLY